MGLNWPMSVSTLFVVQAV